MGTAVVLPACWYQRVWEHPPASLLLQHLQALYASTALGMPIPKGHGTAQNGLQLQNAVFGEGTLFCISLNPVLTHFCGGALWDELEAAPAPLPGSSAASPVHPFLSALLCPLLTVTPPREPYIAFLSLPPHLSTSASARFHVMLSVWFDVGLFSIDLETC